MKNRALNAIAWFVSFSAAILGSVRADEPNPKPPSKSAATPFGLDRRIPWTTSRVVGSPEPPRPFRTERIFPHIQFKHPVVVTMAPGLDRWFVGEQEGKVYSFPNSPDAGTADLFLDTSELLKKEPADSPVKSLEALYGLTFHPRFAENRYCYVCYVVRGSDGNQQLPEGTRVSRFRVTDSNPPRVIPDSEQIVIHWLQGGHNGGCLKFGPDGMLYISTGDGSSAFPPDGLNAGQDVSNLLSAILRIDVDHPADGRQYSIPSDNPFVNLSGARGEIWAYGLRNPWKMSFDRANGDLWVGDVGWELWELVFRIERAGNYGWSIVEGPQSVHVDRRVGPTPILPPALSLPHTDGVSITGGFVYRGKQFPELVGQYIFGDWETRRIWGGRWNGTELAEQRDLVEPTVRVVDFAEDHRGELYVLDYDDGTLHAFVRQSPKQSSQQFPRQLSESGLFGSTADHIVADGVIPFSVNVEQWSDGATAERFVGMPGEGVVKVLPNKRTVEGSMFSSSTEFPVGSVLAKTLSLELEKGKPETRQRIETQLLHFDGKFWNAYTYAWNDEQSDAALVQANGMTREIKVTDPQAPGGYYRNTWRFSSRVECARCHNQWAEYALGFNVRQLNRRHDYGDLSDNQLRALSHVGLLSLEAKPAKKAGQSVELSELDPEGFESAFPHLTNPYDSTADLNDRARSYLHVNCAHCHRNGGGGTAYIELQEELTLAATKTLGTKPTQGTFEIPNPEIIAAGDPFRSVLFYRMAKTGSGRMPHLGSEFVDQRAVRLIHDWIRQLPPRHEETSVLEKLVALDESDASRKTKSPDQQAKREREQTESIQQLLSTTSRALWLVRQLEDGKLPEQTRKRVVELGAARPEPPIRDLFEPYLPDSQRVRRLGTAIDTALLLNRKGDAARGRELFVSGAVANCKSCHQISGMGGKVGPDLTQIGKKYPPAQLLEQIIQPSKVIDPKFQSQLVITTDGRVLTGVVTERTEQQLVLRDAKDQEVRLPASLVEELKLSGQSLMPEQLLRDLTAEQAADLLAYLSSLQ
jgi:uncharacterized repeat protein (TIGR03806 family)